MQVENLLAQAARLEVDDVHTRQAVKNIISLEQVAETMHSRPPRRWWQWGGAFALGAAVAASVFMLWPSATSSPQSNTANGVSRTEPVMPVTIVASSDAKYSQLQTGGMTVHNGTLTIVSQPAEAPSKNRKPFRVETSHAVFLAFAGRATISSTSEHTSVVVHTGSGAVIDGEQRVAMVSGDRWTNAREVLANHEVSSPDSASLSSQSRVVDTPIVSTLPTKRSRTSENESVKTKSSAETVAAASPPLREQWRQVRALIGSREFLTAQTMLLSITKKNDPVWSPLAWLELARLRANHLNDDAGAKRAVEVFLRRYPRHALLKQAKQLQARVDK